MHRPARYALRRVTLESKVNANARCFFLGGCGEKSMNRGGANVEHKIAQAWRVGHAAPHAQQGRIHWVMTAFEHRRDARRQYLLRFRRRLVVRRGCEYYRSALLRPSFEMISRQFSRFHEMSDFGLKGRKSFRQARPHSARQVLNEYRVDMRWAELGGCCSIS